jgi:hypothetical protein
VDREVRDEPLTGELAGQPLSRKNFKLVQGAERWWEEALWLTLMSLFVPLFEFNRIEGGLN